MSGMFSSPKVAPTVVEPVTPEIVDNSDKVQQEERRRKKRIGAAAHFLAGDSSSGSVNTSKTTLGA